MSSTLLALETATDVCSVALMQGDRVTVSLALTRLRAHAETLAPLIQEALRYGGIAPRDLDGVAVSSGPGSYTGLRIGVSTAKGLALAADAPLVAVPSLEALAASVAPLAAPGEAVCALFNARRHEVYAAVFLVAEKNILEARAETAALRVDDVSGWLPEIKGRLWLVGEGAPRVVSALEDHLTGDVRLLDPSVFAPSATSVARLARPSLLGGQVEDVARFEPFYLQAFVAKTPQSSIFEKLPF